MNKPLGFGHHTPQDTALMALGYSAAAALGGTGVGLALQERFPNAFPARTVQPTVVYTPLQRLQPVFTTFRGSAV